jgi:hypothetical protein
MKRLIFGLFFLILGLGLFFYFSHLRESTTEAQIANAELFCAILVTNNEARRIVNEAVTTQELDKAQSLTETLPQKQKDDLLPIIALKRSRILFDEAEKFMRQAVEIEAAASNDSKSLHPLTVVVFNKAAVLYEQSRKESEKIKETTDPNFNYHLNYLKGETYYRFLEMFSDQETAQEMFNQAVTYYKYALRNRPSDINTVVNVELLIKNQNNLLANASSPQSKKKQMLNSKKFGINKSSGN